MQGGTKTHTGAYPSPLPASGRGLGRGQEDASLKFQRSRRPLSTDQGISMLKEVFYGNAECRTEGP